MPSDFTILKKLLLSQNADTIAQGLQIARALGNSKLFDRLLNGIAVHPLRKSGLQQNTAPWVELIPNRHFRDPTGNNTNALAMLALLAAAPSQSMSAQMKPMITGLTIDQNSTINLDYIDVSWLQGLDDLQQLVLYTGHNPVGISTLSTLPALKWLLLAGMHQSLQDLNTLSNCPALEHLGLQDLSPSDPLDLNLPTLKMCLLENVSRLSNLNGLRTLASLRRLSLSRCPDLKALDGIPPVKQLDLWHPWPGLSLTPLSETNIESLQLKNCAPESIEAAKQMPILQHLTLRQMEMTNLLPLAGMRIHTLSLHGMPSMQSLDGLKHMPELKRVQIHRCPPFPIDHATIEDVEITIQ